MLLPKVAITGSSGFVGKHLQERLKAKTYLHNRNGLVSSISSFEPEYIYHLAGEIYNEDEMFESNIKLTYELLEEARKLPNLKAFIYIGSSSEYGGKDHPMSEEDCLKPRNMYEATKGAGTLLCQAYARAYGMPIVIARPFSLYGEHEPDKRFIPTIINSVNKRKRKTLNIAPGVHDFIHIDDFIDGLFLLADNPVSGEVYNFGSGVQTSNDQLVELIEKIMRKEAKKVYIDKLHDYDSDYWVSNSTKAHKIGWKPKYSLTEGLTQVIDKQKEKKFIFGRGK